jgi:hypothetical protein
MEMIAPSVLRSVHSKSAVGSSFLSYSKYFSQSPFLLYCLGVFILLLSFFVPFFILSLVVSLFPVFSVFSFVVEKVPTSKALLRHWVKRFSPHEHSKTSNSLSVTTNDSLSVVMAII